MFKGIFIKNFFNLIINQVINIFIALLATRVLFSTLGEAQFGLVNLALSVVLLSSIAVSYGYHLNGPKRIALFRDQSAKKQSLINEIILTRIIIATGMAIILFCLTYFFGFFKSYAALLYYSLILLFSQALFPMFYFQGNDKIAWASLVNAFAKGAYLLLIILFIKTPDDATYVNFLFGLSALVVYIVFWIIIYKKEKIKWVWVSIYNIKNRFIENFQFFISSIAGHVSIHGGLIILANFVNNTVLGEFALAQKIALLMRMVPIFFTQAILQKASILFKSDKIEFNSYVNRIFIIGLTITFAMGLIVIIFSKWIIFLLAGSHVIYSDTILKILALIPFFSMLNFNNMIKILVDEKKHLLTKATWITAIVMLILATTGSYYYGGYGLSIALVLTEIVSFIVHSVLLIKNNNERV
ncbi:oligosaccharide flippase family protein [Flavobacteriaceae bacterium]|nr:oligosaccharide flippase family protein [Flavobacteriaceae bacterium]MDB4180130.1 oligosaccharide flippase family protein [Flavobacteriaceae bacterium]